MVFALALAFLLVELLLTFLTLLAIIYLGFKRLESSAGIKRDGIKHGKQLPAWQLPDLTKIVHTTPSREKWQLLIFTTAIIESFPSLFNGIKSISKLHPELEVIVIARAGKISCENIAKTLGFQVPVVPVDQTFLNRLKVRVIPFVYLVDPNGIIRWVGLVNTEEQLLNIWDFTRARIDKDFAVKAVHYD